jgi:hypothetical protein
MMAAIPWTAVFNFLLTITGMVIKRVDQGQELEKEFYEFIKKAHEKKVVSSGLMRRYQDSLKK